MATATRSDQELCGGCAYAPGCAIRLRSEGRVLCCDRFIALKGVDDGVVRAVPPAPSSGARSRAAGLCGTCALEEKCKRRYVEGGVWRCADYR